MSRRNKIKDETVKKKTNQKRKPETIKIEGYKKQLKSGVFDVEDNLKIAEDGTTAIIDCKITTASDELDVYDRFDINAERTLSSAFTQYLVHSALIIPMKYDLELDVHVHKNFEPKNEVMFTKAVKRELAFDIKNNIINMRSGKRKSLIMIMLSVVFFITYFWASHLEIWFLPDILQVLCWVFLWETVSSLIWDTPELRQKRYNNLRLYNAKIVFIRTKRNI